MGRTRPDHAQPVDYQLGVELLAKTLHPFVGKTADYNFAESTAFLSRISQASKRNAPGVQQMSTRLANVEAPVRTRFAEIAALVNQRATVRDTTPPASPPDDAQIVPSSAVLPGNRAALDR